MHQSRYAEDEYLYRLEIDGRPCPMEESCKVVQDPLRILALDDDATFSFQTGILMERHVMASEAFRCFSAGLEPKNINRMEAICR